MEIQRRRKRRRDETSSFTAWESPWYVRREKVEPGKVAIFQGKEADVSKSTQRTKFYVVEFHTLVALSLLCDASAVAKSRKFVHSTEFQPWLWSQR